jgi:biotin carboxyl carrier protein
MPYISTVNNQAYRVDVDAKQHTITLEGQTHAIDWQRIAPLASDARVGMQAGGRYSLIVEGVSYEVFARRVSKPEEKDSQVYEIQFAGRRFEVQVEDERTRQLTGLAKPASATGEARIQAPMPGLVVGMLLEEGAQVVAGQAVVVLEAMKMENDLVSPIAGVIKTIKVNKGQTVDQGDVLLVVTAE